MSPTISSPIVQIRWSPSTTSPITEHSSSQRAHSACTSARRLGSTQASMRSCDSEIMISNASMSASRSGTLARSSFTPTGPREAISDADEARPAAPRSCRPTSTSSRTSSSEVSIRRFSM